MNNEPILKQSEKFALKHVLYCYPEDKTFAEILYSMEMLEGDDFIEAGFDKLGLYEDIDNVSLIELLIALEKSASELYDIKHNYEVTPMRDENVCINDNNDQWETLTIQELRDLCNDMLDEMPSYSQVNIVCEHFNPYRLMKILSKDDQVVFMVR